MCGWSATTRISTGTIAATSSPRRPRPCAGSWWSVPAASERRKHGGGLLHQDSNLDDLAGPDTRDPLEVLAVHEALDQLAEKAPRKAELVKLRYFLGCTMAEAAQVLGIAQSTAEEDWTYSKAWLRRRWLRGEQKEAPG